MLRVASRGLILPYVRRPTFVSAINIRRSRSLFSTVKTHYHQQLVPMAEEAVPSCDGAKVNGPAPAPAKEEPALPKLSAQEYRIYNRMADSMNLYVSPTIDHYHMIRNC